MLSQKALLVYLSISQWTGRKLDKKATGHVESTFATDKSAGNYTKKLLPGAPELERIQSLAGSIRKFYYEQTLPWMNDGARIISSKNYMDFQKEFRQRKISFDIAVDAFLVQYPNLKSASAIRLGELFNEHEYPSEIKLRQSFQCEVRFLPVPDVSDYRTEVLSSEKDAFIKSMRDVESTALRDCWSRLHDVVSKAASRLKQPDAIFRDSLIENITDICTLLPKLNVTDDPALEQARLDVQAIASKISPDTCRANQTERAEQAKRLAEISERMGAFMGGAQ